MPDIAPYRIALIEVKNKIDTYKKNKLTLVIFSLLFLLLLLAIATALLLNSTLMQSDSHIGPATIAMMSFGIMLWILAIGYWLIFKNPSIDAKREILYLDLVSILSQVSPHSELYRALIEDYKSKRINEHALLNMVLAELRRTETLT